jgi:hypothetical protein
MLEKHTNQLNFLLLNFSTNFQIYYRLIKSFEEKIMILSTKLNHFRMEKLNSLNDEKCSVVNFESLSMYIYTF